MREGGQWCTGKCSSTSQFSKEKHPDLHIFSFLWCKYPTLRDFKLPTWCGSWKRCMHSAFRNQHEPAPTQHWWKEREVWGCLSLFLPPSILAGAVFPQECSSSQQSLSDHSISHQIPIYHSLLLPLQVGKGWFLCASLLLVNFLSLLPVLY